MQPDSTPTKNAILYLRVSSEEQVENFSLGTQEEICRREALHKGYEVIEVFKEEGKSAKTISGRPELLRLLDFCRRNRKLVDAVIVYRLDRLSRQTQDYLTLRKRLYDYGITLISANEPTGNSPTDKLLETIMASFAQHDNDVRSERTRNGLRARFMSGLCTGKVPLGYLMQHGYAIKDGENFDKMKKAWDLMLTGTKSLAEMAKIMNDWGLRKVIAGKEYYLRAQTADRLFRCKFYAGFLTSTKYPDEVKGQHEAMITEKQFYKVQAIIDGRNRSGMSVGKRLKDNPDFPLRKTIKCGKCGGVLSGGWSKGRSKKYAYYICKNRCGASSIKVQLLSDSLIEFLRSITPPKEKLELFLMLLRMNFNQNIALLRTKREKAEQEITKFKQMKITLGYKNLQGTFTDEDFQQQKKAIDKDVKALEMVLGRTIYDQYTYEEVAKFMREKFSDLGTTYLKSNPGEARVLLGSICPTGLSWQYSGLSNQQFSPEYQAILDVRTDDFALSTAYGSRTRDFRDENPMS